MSKGLSDRIKNALLIVGSIAAISMASDDAVSQHRFGRQPIRRNAIPHPVHQYQAFPRHFMHGYPYPYMRSSFHFSIRFGNYYGPRAFQQVIIPAYHCHHTRKVIDDKCEHTDTDVMDNGIVDDTSDYDWKKGFEFNDPFADIDTIEFRRPGKNRFEYSEKFSSADYIPLDRAEDYGISIDDAKSWNDVWSNSWSDEYWRKTWPGNSIASLIESAVVPNIPMVDYSFPISTDFSGIVDDNLLRKLYYSPKEDPEVRARKVNSALTVLLHNYNKEVDNKSPDNPIDMDYIAALTRAESNFKPHAQSPTGPRGLMQVAAGTGNDMLGIDNFRELAFNPLINTKAGIRYLVYMDEFATENVSGYENMSKREKQKKLTSLYYNGSNKDPSEYPLALRKHISFIDNLLYE
jgi:hypothetical protein